MEMGKPTNYITMREDEWEELEALKKIISRARQLQDSQLLAAASFGTSKKKGPQIH
jgi:hypothetical protein